MGTPTTGGGGSQKAASKKNVKNMKRCSHCGAKNKDTFEYCVRCSEPLDSGGSWVEPSERRSPMVTIAGAGVIGIVAFAALALMRGSPDGEPVPVASPRTTPAPSPAAERRGEAIFADIDSKEVLAKYTAGLTAFNQGDYDTAVERFLEVVRDLPDNPAAHQYLGLAYYRRGDMDDAIDTLETARNLRPHSFQLLDQYVTACKEAGDSERAIAALQDYVADHPDELDVRLEIARIARESGNEALAIEQSEYLATANNLDPEFVYEYGVTLKEAGRLDEAKAVLRNSVELDPDSAVAHHALGVTELVSGNAAAAVDSLEAAVARAPTNGDFRFTLAQAYEKLDRIEESLAAYDAYLEHARPDDQRAEIVRKQLAIAKKALAAERKRQREGKDGPSP